MGGGGGGIGRPHGPPYLEASNLFTLSSKNRAWAVAKLFPEIRVAAKYVIDLCAIVRIEDEKLLCDKCGMFYFNTIEHILFSCDLLVELREDLWRDIIHINQIDFSVYRKRRRRKKKKKKKKKKILYVYGQPDIPIVYSRTFIVRHKIRTGQ